MNRPARDAGAARVAAESVLVLLLALAYLWLFRAYGFDVVDEGTQLAQIDRVARGARPYVDFETGYTPWYYLLEVSLWRFGGTELLATRTFGVALHATTIALLFAVARLWFGPLLALSLAAFDLAFLLPVSPRAGAPFNTPYPGWITAPLALAAQVLVAAVVHGRLAGPPAARGARGDGAAALLACGVVAGVAFSVKPNAGLLALAGAALALLPSWPAGERAARALSSLVRGMAIAATLLLLGDTTLDPAYAAALLLPVVLAAWRAAPLGASGAVRPLSDAAALAIGFLAPVAIWALPLLRELGPGTFAGEVLLLDGGGVVDAYLLPFAAPTAAVLVACAGVVAAAVLARRAHAPAQSHTAWLAPAVLVLAGVVAAALGRGEEARGTVELACLWLGPVGLAAGILLVPRATETARVHALLAFAAIFSLQLFPRPDLIHVAMGGPPLLLAIGAAWWRLSPPPSRPPVRPFALPAEAIATVLVLIACAARAYPALQVRLAEPLAELDAGPRAPLVIAARYADQHRWLGETVRAISERSAPGDAVFYFPDLAGLGFLAQRPAPFFYLYFVPGRPDRAGEQRTIAELERLAPRLAVTGSPRVPAFARATTFFAGLEVYLGRHYRPALDVGACTIRERRADR